MKSRLAFIVGGALIINILLFILMERMSAQQPIQLSAVPSRLSIDFVRLKKQPPPQQQKSRQKPKQQKAKPKSLLMPDMPSAKPKPLRVKNINIDLPRMDLAINIAGVPFKGEMASSGFGGLSEAIPLIRTSPLYPPRALSRKLEGKVKVLFTISADGTVISPKVIESTPKGVFDRSALRAVRKWKFRKKLIDGQAVAWQSVQTIVFKLAK